MGEMGAFLAKKIQKKKTQKKNGGALCGIEPYCPASGCFNQQAIVWLLKSKMTQIGAPVMMPLSVPRTERRGWGRRGGEGGNKREKEREERNTSRETQQKVRVGEKKIQGVRERPRRQISPPPLPSPALPQLFSSGLHLDRAAAATAA